MNKYQPILKKIRTELINNIEENYRKNNLRFHKNKVNTYGIRTPIVRKIAKKYFKEIKRFNKKEIFEICKELFKSQYTEENIIAIQWIVEIKSKWDENDFKEINKLFEYIDNWGNCDDFCLSIISHFIIKFSKYKKNIKAWSKSNNQWKRRASAVSFIQGGSWELHPEYLEDVFDIANELLTDKEDLVLKGYGWMLKIASQTFQKEVFNFVILNKSIMPRTALRYAIEKMPINLKKEAMKKD